MEIEILDKTDCDGVEKIIALGYPKNEAYLDELLAWTCDPNWPVAGGIYEYFRELGKKEAYRVLRTAENVGGDFDWRYTLITQIISAYDDSALAECVGSLKRWAAEIGTGESDIESLRILTEHKLLSAEEIVKITRRNLYQYNVCIKETMDATEAAMRSLPYGEYTL